MPTPYDDKGVIKRPGLKMQMTKEQVMEIILCSKDIEYFAEKYFTIVTERGKELIKLRDYQKEMLNNFISNKLNLCTCPRQSGKTTIVEVFALHYALYNRDKTIMVLAHKLSMAKSILSEIQMAYEHLPPFLKQGVKQYNKTSIEFENGTKIIANATSPDSIRGESPNLVILDEFAFVPEHVSDAFYMSTYPTIAASKGTMLIISTPNGTSNLFYRLWADANSKKNNFKTIRVPWNCIPERDENWKNERIKDIGVVRWKQEFECLNRNSMLTVQDENGIIYEISIKDLYEKRANVL